MECSMAKAWEILTDVNRWSEWDTEISGAKLSGEFKQGAKGEISPKKGRDLPFFVSEFIPEKSYTFVNTFPFGTLEIKRTINQNDNLVDFTDEVKFTGILKRLLGVLLGRKFRSVLPEVMENFKRIAEETTDT